MVDNIQPKTARLCQCSRCAPGMYAPYVSHRKYITNTTTPSPFPSSTPAGPISSLPPRCNDRRPRSDRLTDRPTLKLAYSAQNKPRRTQKDRPPIYLAAIVAPINRRQGSTPSGSETKRSYAQVPKQINFNRTKQLDTTGATKKNGFATWQHTRRCGNQKRFA